jgi:hypothetical protein
MLTLTFCAALLGEVARLHDRRANLVGRQPHGGGMPRPGHIGAMEIAAVARIAMEFIQRPQRWRLLSALISSIRRGPQRYFDLAHLQGVWFRVFPPPALRRAAAR